ILPVEHVLSQVVVRNDGGWLAIKFRAREAGDVHDTFHLPLNARTRFLELVRHETAIDENQSPVRQLQRRVDVKSSASFMRCEEMTLSVVVENAFHLHRPIIDVVTGGQKTFDLFKAPRLGGHPLIDGRDQRFLPAKALHLPGAKPQKDHQRNKRAANEHNGSQGPAILDLRITHQLSSCRSNATLFLNWNT